MQRGSETRRLQYISVDGLEFWNTEAVRQHLASSRMTAVVKQQTISTNEHCVTDESGLEYFPKTVLASTTSLYACKLKRTQYVRKCMSWESTMLVARTHRKMAAVHFTPSLLVLVESAMKR